MTKLEIRNRGKADRFEFRTSDLIRHSDFVIRHYFLVGADDQP